MPTLSCLVAPPCTLVLLIVCKRRSLPWLLPPSRSRLLLPQKGNTLSGLEDPSWHPSPPSNRCGSPSKSTMNVAHPLSTGSASKLNLYYCFYMYLSKYFIPIQKNHIDHIILEQVGDKYKTNKSRFLIEVEVCTQGDRTVQSRKLPVMTEHCCISASFWLEQLCQKSITKMYFQSYTILVSHKYQISSKFSKFSIKIRIVPAFSEFSEDFFLIRSKVNSSKGSKVEISHCPTNVSIAKLLFHTLIFKGS